MLDLAVQLVEFINYAFPETVHCVEVEQLLVGHFLLLLAGIGIPLSAILRNIRKSSHHLGDLLLDVVLILSGSLIALDSGALGLLPETHKLYLNVVKNLQALILEIALFILFGF